ncbi:acyltransferase [Citrobacter sp. Marseille-Q3906]|uniref:acyltransferase family protein n=1 Tax=Citrobacter sp. Marseille-Q3906 TaxID=2866574 RepID=UPI001CE3CCE2|nr:acyltransferase [Citrobacter sp. Marseille-Q3906]
MNVKCSDNFTLIRLVLAVGVLLVHNGGITNSDVLKPILSYLSGDVIVECFFVISGYLIVKSYMRNQRGFFYRRALRLLPAYYFCLSFIVFCASVVAMYCIGEHFFNLDLLKYIVANAVFMNFLHPALPGIFVDNPLTAVNGSLWTLKTEIILYLSVPIFFYIYVRNKMLAFTLVCLVSVPWLFYFRCISDSPNARMMSLQFVGMAAYFFGGALFAIVKNFIKLIPPIAVVSAICYMLAEGKELRFLSEYFLVVSSVLFCCLNIPLGFNFEKIGDFSYGIYLYNFPVIQLLYSLGLYNTHPYLSFGLSLILTFFVASGSWYLVERRFLQLKSRVR